MLNFNFVAALAATLFCAAAPAAAEPARADPTFFIAADVHPRALAEFTVAGADLSLLATGRFAAADTARASHDIEEAVEMRAFLPGYPQPAFVTFDLRLAF